MTRTSATLAPGLRVQSSSHPGPDLVIVLVDPRPRIAKTSCPHVQKAGGRIAGRQVVQLTGVAPLGALADALAFADEAQPERHVPVPPFPVGKA
jgi:hypothetical protein